jgi:PAS domain S-box-containing protein
MDDSRSVTGRHANQAARETHEALFIALSSLVEDSSVAFAVSVLGLIIQNMQLLSFAFAPLYQYDLVGVKQMAYFTYAFRFPVWDGITFGEIPIVVPLVFTCILLLVAVGVAIAVFALVEKKIERRGWISAVAATILQALGGFLFIPTLHVVLSPLFCNDGNLRWFPSHGQCWDGQHLAVFILGIPAVIALGTVNFCAATFLCRINNSLSAGDPTSNEGGHALDRPHAYVEVAMASAKLALVLAFHTLIGIPDDGRMAFAVVLLIYCVTGLVLHMAMLPYHSQWVSKCHCAFFLVTAWAAVLNIAIVGGDGVLASRHLHSFIFISTVPIVAYIGSCLADYRLSDEAEHRLDVLEKTGTVGVHEARFPFPVHLLESELSRLPPKYRALEADFIASTDRPVEGLEERMARLQCLVDQLIMPEQVSELCEMLVPMLEQVRIATDAEVATRSLKRVSQITKQCITGPSLAFGLRIFTKTMVHCKNAGVTITHLAAFSFYHALKQAFTLQLTDYVEYRAVDYDMWILLMTYRLAVEVKRFFGLHDAARLETFSSAKRLHKASLVSIASFWTKLMSGATDLIGIIQVTNTLTDQRINAFETYQQALMSYGSDRQLLILYSAFLSDVMLEPRTAAQVKAFAEDLAEEKRSRLLQGGGKRNGTDRALSALLISAVATQTTTSTPSSAFDANVAVEGKIGAKRRRFTPTVVAMIFSTFLAIMASLGIFCAVVVQVTQDVTTIDAADSLGRVYTGVSLGNAQLDEMAWEIPSSFTITANTNPLSTDSLTALGRTEAALSAHMNKFVVKSTGFNTVIRPRFNALFFSGESATVDNSGDQGSWIQQGFSDLFTLTASIRVAMTSAINDAASSAVAPIYYAEYVAKNYNQNVNEGFLYAFDVYHESVEYRARGVLAAAAAFLVFGTFALVIVYSSLHVNLENGGNMKATVIQLFSLIPYATQQALEADSRRRVDMFDQWEDEDGVKDDPDLGALEDNQRTGPEERRVSAVRSRSDLFSESRKMSMMVGRKRAVAAERLRGALKPVSNYGTVGKREVPVRRRRVVFDLPEAILKKSEAEKSKKRLMEPKILLQLTESAGDVANAGPGANKRRKNRRDAAGAKQAQAAVTADAAAGISAIFALALCVAVLALLGMTIDRELEVENKTSHSAELHEWASSNIDNFAAIVDNAHRFIAFGTLARYSTFYELIASATTVDRLCTTPIANALVTYDIRKSMGDARPHMLSYLARVQIAVAIAAAAQSVESTNTPHVAGMRWPAAQVSSDVLRHYSDAVNVSVSAFADEKTVRQLAAVVRNETATPAARQAATETLMQMAKNAIARDEAELDRKTAMDALTTAYDLVSQSIQSWTKEQEATSDYYTGAAVGCAAALTLLFIVTLIVLVATTSSIGHKLNTTGLVGALRFAWKTTLQERPVDTVLTSIGILVSLCATLLAIGAMAKGVNTGIVEEQVRYLTNIRSSFYDNQAQIGSFLLSQRSMYALHAVEGRVKPVTFNEFLGTSLVDGGLNRDAVRGAFDVVTRNGNISMLLMIYSSGLINRSSARQYFSLTSSYDASLEPSHDIDQIIYRDDFPQYRYTRFRTDIQQNSTQLTNIARLTFFGTRAFNNLKQITDFFRLAAAATQRALGLEETIHQRRSLYVAAIVFISVAAVCVLMIFNKLLMTSLRISTGSITAQDLLSHLFASNIRRIVSAVGLLFLVLLAQFILVAAYQSLPSDMSDVLINAHRRSAHVADSLKCANELKRRVDRGVAAVSLDLFPLTEPFGAYVTVMHSQQRLCTAGARLASARSAVGFSSIAETSAQLGATFGGPAPTLDRRLIDWTSSIATLCSIKFGLQTVVSGAGNGTVTQYDFTLADRALVTTAVAAMRQNVLNVLNAIEKSTEIYKSDASDRVSVPVIPAAITLALFVIIAFLEDRLIFNPTGARLAREEHGAKLLLNMIPPSVRSVVPKIRLYLETGVIVDDTLESNAHQMTCPVASEFVSGVQAGAPLEDAMSNLAHSQFATVLIDQEGIIRHVNRGLTELLEYEPSDLIGENVKILADEPIRSLHDSFLKRYNSVGTSRMVGQKPRDFFAVAKNGTRRHIMLKIVEASRPDGTIYFLGMMQLYDIASVTDDATVAAALASVERD